MSSHERPKDQPLYPENEYGLNPDAYHPRGIDLIADYLQRTFALEELPKIGLVRHIMSAPESGLERFLRERKGAEQVGGGAKKRIEETHAPAVRRLIDQALKLPRTKTPEIPPVERPYAGLVAAATKSVDFGQPKNSEGLAWALGFVNRIKHEQAAGRSGMAMLRQFCEHLETSGATESAKNFREEFLNKVEELGDEAESVRRFLPEMVRDYLNKSMLFGQGMAVTRPAGLEDTLQSELIHHIRRYETPTGPVSVAYVSNAESPYAKRSPCYDGSDDMVYMSCAFLIQEIQQTMMHGFSGKLAREIGTEAQDYREGRKERNYYKAIWERHGNPDLLMEMIGKFEVAKLRGSSIGRHVMPGMLLDEDEAEEEEEPEIPEPIVMMRRLKGNPILAITEETVLIEEIRHAIDHYAMMKHLDELEGKPPADFVAHRALFKPGSKILSGFLGQRYPEDKRERDMLCSMIDELTAKLATAAVCPDPQMMIAHLRYCAEDSRLLSKERRETFRSDLLNANRANEDRTSSWHPMAAKVASVMLGNHFGIRKAECHLDAEYDHVDVCNNYALLARMKPDELRLGIKKMMEPELVIPVDCAPFAKLDAHGRRIAQDA